MGLAQENEIVKFKFPKNRDEGSCTISLSDNDDNEEINFECKNIFTLMKENSHDRIDILKIDIEGG